MKKVLLSTALIAAVATSATAGGVHPGATVQPVAPTVGPDVAVGSFDGVSPVLLAAGGVLLLTGLLHLSDDESDGTAGEVLINR